MTKTTSKHLRAGLILALISVVSSCQVEPSPEAGSADAGRPTFVAYDEARRDLVELAHDLAVTLGDQGV